jgi:prepilin-type N-terminal cleavage/methylation domain-containing protein
MTSSIGNDLNENSDGRNMRAFFNIRNTKRARSARGFTFFEVMVTVMILGVGIAFIYRAFLTCLRYQDYLTARMHVLQITDQKLAQWQRQYQETGELPGLLSADIIPETLNNRPYAFQYDSNFTPVGILQNIFKMDLIVSWKDYDHNYRITRSAYLSRI